MVKSTIGKILNGNGYKISKKDIESVLIDMKYTLDNKEYLINAIKISNYGRFHFNIDIHQDGEVHDTSEVSLHLDIGKGIFHGVELNGKNINNEFTIFYKKLLERCNNVNLR